MRNTLLLASALALLAGPALAQGFQAADAFAASNPNAASGEVAPGNVAGSGTGAYGYQADVDTSAVTYSVETRKAAGHQAADDFRLSDD